MEEGIRSWVYQILFFRAALVLDCVRRYVCIGCRGLLLCISRSESLFFCYNSQQKVHIRIELGCVGDFCPELHLWAHGHLAWCNNRTAPPPFSPSTHRRPPTSHTRPHGSSNIDTSPNTARLINGRFQPEVQHTPMPRISRVTRCCNYVQVCFTP